MINVHKQRHGVPISSSFTYTRKRKLKNWNYHMKSQLFPKHIA